MVLAISTFAILMMGIALITMAPNQVEARSDECEPRNLEFEIISGDPVLTWNSPSDCSPDSYDVYRRLRTGDGWQGPGGWDGKIKLIASGITAKSYTDSSVEPGSKYRYRVQAVNGTKKSNKVDVTVREEEPPPSKEGGATPNNDDSRTRNTHPDEMDEPEGPPEFTDTNRMREFDETFADEVAEATNIGQPVSATDPDDDNLMYSLVGNNADRFDIIADTGQLRTRVGMKYDYEEKSAYIVTVKASDDDDNMDSVMIIVAVMDVDEPPQAPKPVFVSANHSASKLNVSWSPQSNTGRPPIGNYDLQYREIGEEFRNGPQNVSGLRTTVSGLKAGTFYEVRVRATNHEGDSVCSEGIRRPTAESDSREPPGKVYGLDASGVSETQIDLSWDIPFYGGSTSIIGYKIEFSEDGETDDAGEFVSSDIRNTNNASYSFRTLSPGVTRYYRVSAVNSVGAGKPSAIVSAQTHEENTTPEAPGVMYVYFTASNSDMNGSEEANVDSNYIDGDCFKHKYFRAYWTEPNSPPVAEWEVKADGWGGAIASQIMVRYKNGDRERPEVTGMISFAAGPDDDEFSSVSLRVRGRYGDNWSRWGPTSGLYCKDTR